MGRGGEAPGGHGEGDNQGRITVKGSRLFLQAEAREGTRGSIAIGRIGIALMQADCGTMLFLSLSFEWVCTEIPYLKFPGSQMASE